MPATPNCPLCNTPEPHPLPVKDGEYFHCAVCDLRFQHPDTRLDRKSEHERYLQHENNSSDLRYRKFLEPLHQAMSPMLTVGAKGLDFGAGPNSVLGEIFVEAGFEVEVYDPFFAPHPHLLNQIYDFVLASEVAEHFFSPAKEFQLLLDLLKPGGQLGLMTLLVNEAVDFATWYYRKDPTHVVFYSQKTFSWIVARYGFEPPKFHSERVVSLRKPVLSK